MFRRESSDARLLFQVRGSKLCRLGLENSESLPEWKREKMCVGGVCVCVCVYATSPSKLQTLILPFGLQVPWSRACVWEFKGKGAEGDRFPHCPKRKQWKINGWDGNVSTVTPPSRGLTLKINKIPICWRRGRCGYLRTGVKWITSEAHPPGSLANLHEVDETYCITDTRSSRPLFISWCWNKGMTWVDF